MSKPNFPVSKQLSSGLFQKEHLDAWEKNGEVCKLFFLDSDRSEKLTSDSNIKEYQESPKNIRKIFRIHAIQSAFQWWARPNFSKECMAAENTISTCSENKLLVEVGGGPARSHGSTTLNVYPWENVDIIGDAHDLPYKDCVVDNIMSRAVLEHLEDPQTAVNEMYRVLKKGGGWGL